MEARTHLRIDAALCGTPVELAPGRARVRLTASDRMAADERGLVHGGFAFGLADYAAMLAVNEPTVVLGRADVAFLAPVVVGEDLEAAAVVAEEDGRKRRVDVEVTRSGEAVFRGTFQCFVPDGHVLDRT